MADKNRWWHHPHGNLMAVIPLAVYLVIEDNTITRCLLASGLAFAAVRYGKDLAARSRAKTDSPLTPADDTDSRGRRRSSLDLSD
ncbi:hypothetical protein [Streptomyces sp. NPDC003483]